MGVNDHSFIGMAVDRLNFETPTALAVALADRVASELTVAVNERGNAVLAVSGGRTPEIFFYYLSKAEIAWEHITITLVDERYVPTTSVRSNEKLVRSHLLQHCAAKARFIGLYNETITAELAAFSAAARVSGLLRPFDVVVLGMGEDGHTASLFPNGDRLKQALDPNSQALVLPIHAKKITEPRLTMTLPVLTSARFIALHLEGQPKLDSLTKALQTGDELAMPIRAVLSHAAHPVQVYWSPFAHNHDLLLETSGDQIDDVS